METGKLARNPVLKTAAALLNQLKLAQGKWISGAELSRQLQVSRTAVWKHICALKTDGYRIDASTRKGYILREIPDLLRPRELREGLKTRSLGQQEIRYFDQTDSTNLQAKAMAAAGAPEGTLIIAEEQTAGRGRRGRTWFSPPGAGIYMSLIIRPAILPQEAPRFALLAVAAVAAAVRETTFLTPRIKWPNDILLNGRKLGGILTEVSMEMDKVEYLIIGLGLNVSLAREAFPPELRETGTSIRAELGRSLHRLPLVRGILESLERTYEEYQTHGFASIRKRWQDFTDMIGRTVTVDTLGRRLTGEVMDFDEDGYLVVREHNGGPVRIFSGDVSFS
jgi:BirA family transcriptional regulator, biotin operon repressor / biotin---[acetyl-CoA-carboxylase] ligase